MPQILDTALPLRPPPSPPPARAYLKPEPRAPKSPAHSAQIRVQNRRREYLERHPSYLDSAEHELADPLLYDALVRRFQSPAERARDGRAKGYSRVLEADLLRGEARLAHLAQGGGAGAVSAAAADQDAYIREYADFAAPPPVQPGIAGSSAIGSNPEAPVSSSSSSAAAGAPSTPAEGRERWRDFLRRRFVLGRDEDFEYRGVDEDEEYDAIERREREDAWFEDEDPGWASEEEEGEAEGGGEGGEKAGNEKIERPLRGETGVQDF